MNLKQGFETLHTIMYDKDSLDDPAVISEITKDSLIKGFKDHKADFTNKLKLRKCIISQFNEAYYANLSEDNITDLFNLLQDIINRKVVESGLFTYDRSSKKISAKFS